ncbi:MAG: hypothetical protein ISS79_13090 [Phycisphaerae bacterium]|nr:hypothetical protein [Phycisphaerae bacterium]
MANGDSKSWQFNRQVNVSTLVQLVLLAFLIIGSYVNLQRQLDLLQRDVTMLLQCQKDFSLRIEGLSATSISHEYRLRALEKDVTYE